MQGKFKEFVLSEGKFWDALCSGVKAGVKEFNKKRKEQKQPEPKTLTHKILSAEGKELEALVKQIVDNGYTIRQGKVQKPPERVKSTDWLLECTRTKKASASGRSRSMTFQSS